MDDLLTLEQFSNALTKQTPVDIITFAEHKDYLGQKLYPRDTLCLKLFYQVELSIPEKADLQTLIDEGKVPVDILQRGPFSELVLVIGRRGGKTFLASIIACYELYKLLLIDNPQAHYGISEKDPIYVANCAVSGAQAKTPMFEAISNKILDCPWFEDKIVKARDMEIKFRSQSDARKEKEIYLLYGIKQEISSIRAVALHTKSSSTRGKNIIVAIFDELAHFDETAGTGSANSMYEAIKPSTKTFGVDGKVVDISSPLTQGGKFYELYLKAYGNTITGKKLSTDVTKEFCVIQMPTWYINPNITRESLRDEEEANPENFMMEYGAEFGLTIDRFLEPSKVDAVFDATYEFKDKGMQIWRYEIHCDPAKSDAGMSIAVAHREGDFAIIDHMKVFQAEDAAVDEDGMKVINYQEVEDYLFNLVMKFPSTKTLSFDQWNSVGLIQRLRKRLRDVNNYTRVTEETFTDGSNYSRYDNLKRCINRGMVKCYPTVTGHEAALLSTELKHLQEKDGRKVIKQSTGVCTTKDLSDSVAVITERLLKEPEPNQKTRNRMPAPRVARTRA